MTQIKTLHTLTLDITLQAPFVSQASGVSKPGLDVLLLRNQNNKIALPGTLIRGNLLHAMKRLAADLDAGNINSCLDQAYIDTLFGKGSSEEYLPQRSKLQFDAYWTAQQVPEQDSVQYRIRIDETGTVKEGQFVVIESPWPADTVVDFRGKVHFWGTQQEAQQLENFIRSAFELIPALGAFKGVGFGQCARAINVTATKQATASNLHLTEEQGAIQIALQFKAPFCFATRMQGNNTTYTDSEFQSSQQSPEQPQKGATQNRFASVDYVPGNAIKGAMVNQLLSLTGCKTLADITEQDHKELATVARHIENLTIQHALPGHVEETRPPVYHPLSLVRVKQLGGNPDAYCDMLSYLHSASQTGYFKADNTVLDTAYATDWKSEDFDDCAQTISTWQSRTDVTAPDFISHRIVQIHTSIREGGSEAEEHQLFSYECIQPTDNQQWMSSFVLPKTLTTGENIEEQAKLLKGLSTLLAQGLGGLGKTDAFATVSHSNKGLLAYRKSQERIINTLQSGQLMAIQLNSDTQLLPCLTTLAVEAETGPQLDPQTLFTQYQRQITQLSGSSLILKNFYAEQTLVGGEYYRSRFWKHISRDNYLPQLLTLKGSVFLCQVENAKQARDTLSVWVARGIPVLSSASGKWQENPYLPTLGAGQIHLYQPESCRESSMTWQALDMATLDPVSMAAQGESDA